MLHHLMQQLAQDGSVTFSVRVRPNARQTTIKNVLSDGTLKIDLHAPAEEGRANAELMRLLETVFHVEHGRVEIVTGQTSGRKRICVTKNDTTGRDRA